MDRLTRLTLMTEALGTLAASDLDGNFVIFEDLKTNDYVQLMLFPFLGKGDELGPSHVRLPLTAERSVQKVEMEVTDRGLNTIGPPIGMPPLSPLQVAAIKDRGFALGDHPNFTVFIDLDHLDDIAQECEYLFNILGSSASFELGVTTAV